jgi:ubiquinone/menaquinone biosynthesis C-methylase UbiE
MIEKNHIKEFWDEQALTYGESHLASWGDNFMLDLEIQTIGKHLKENDVVLDVGCANGYSTFRQIETHALQSISGVDFSSPMIESANIRKMNHPEKAKMDFNVGDIRNLEFADHTFDVVYTTRVIINLPTWKEQQQAINECIRVAKPNGKIIFSEAFWEPLMLLNALRSLKQLPALVEHDFNRYLKKEAFEKYLHDLKLPFTNEDFSSVYYLGSRFLRELVTNPKDYAGYSNPINEIFYRLEQDYSGGGFGIQQAYVIQKIGPVT